MIDLHPHPDAQHDCPYCDIQLNSVGWYIPGMRNLAELECPKCKREFFGDLPVDHGILYPSLVEKESGVVFGQESGTWFKDYLEKGYNNRSDEKLDVIVDVYHGVNNPLLVNTLDMNYAHSIKYVLSIQYYLDNHPEKDIIVIIAPFLTWLVPEGVSEVWVIPQSLSEGRSWNDWLAKWIHERIEQYEECKISIMPPHIYHSEYNIERFTGVKPFPVDEWEPRLRNGPTVTFIWRDIPSYGSVSRLWCSMPDSSDKYRRVRGYANLIAEKLGTHVLGFKEQKKNILTAAEELKSTFPDIDMAVAGVGEPGDFPDWISDLRYPKPSDEEEQELCRRYAESHLAIGTHGSHMSLPSAHAGSVLEIMPPWKRGNMGGDLLLREDGQRETILRYRHVPANVSAKEVAREASHMLVDWPLRKIRMSEQYCTHEMDKEQLYAIRELEGSYSELIDTISDEPRSQIGSNLTRGIYDRIESVVRWFR